MTTLVTTPSISDTLVMETKKKKKKKPYEQRTDLNKIEAQWTKLSGLHDRADWSAAVVRAATATEIAVNLAIRREFAARSELNAVFVDSLLRWANGLTGKLDRLLLPLLKDSDQHKVTSDLCKLARRINDKRNDIAHRGHFSSSKEATALIEDCKTFVHGIVRTYKPEFTLKDPSNPNEET